MEKPIGIIATLAASGKNILGTIPIVRARTISVTLRGTFHGSATGDLRVNARYSPDGKFFDTDPVDSFDLAVSAGNTRQTTGLLAVPEHGFVQLEIENLDAVRSATDLTLWFSVQSWPNTPPSYGGIPPNVKKTEAE